MRNIFKNTKPTGKLMINHESWGVYVFQTNPYTGNPGFSNQLIMWVSCKNVPTTNFQIERFESENLFAIINKKGISETYGDTNQSWHYCILQEISISIISSYTWNYIVFPTYFHDMNHLVFFLVSSGHGISEEILFARPNHGQFPTKKPPTIVNENGIHFNDKNMVQYTIW
jgi:hypothetical protein